MHELVKVPIKLDNISDVIYDKSDWHQKKYFNTVTKKTGNSIDDVKTQKRYIILKENKQNWGYYAVRNNQHNALIIVMALFIKGKWNEVGRIILFRDKVIKTQYFDMTNVVDMMGQYVKGSTDEYGFNAPFYGAKTLREFFGGVCFVEDRGKLESSSILSDFRELNNIIMDSSNRHNEYNYADDFMYGMQQINSNGRTIERKRLPKEFMNRIGCYFNNFMKAHGGRLGDYKKPFNGTVKVSYLQDYNGVPVLRCFICIVKPEDDFSTPKPLKIETIEYKRIWFDKKIDGEKINIIDVSLIFYDKTVSGMFKYVKPVIQNIVNYSKKKIEKKQQRGIQEKLKGKSLKTAYIIATEPFCEKLNNSPYKKLASEMNEKLGERFLESPRIVMENLFGTICWDKKSFHQMLGVPKEVIETVEKYKYDNPSYFIRFLKTMFNDYPEFLMSIGHKAVEFLFSNYYTKNFEEESPTRLRTAANVSKLIKIFGPDNWENYLDYITKHHENDMKYFEYLDKLVVVRNMAEGFEWRLDGVELDRANTSITPAYYAALDKTSYERYSESFKKQAETWKQYEFKKDGLVITYPKVPSELVMEGIKLNHCAKQFLDIVSERKTTILFIRKEKNLEKPYFTLEIRSGRIRQCHGHNNCTISENPKLEPFLREFCRKNNIEYTEGTSMLGV